MIDGVFSAEGEALRFHQAIVTREAIAKVQAEVRVWVLRLFKRRALLSPEDVNAMREWGMKAAFPSMPMSLSQRRTAPAYEFDQTVSW